MPRPENWNDRSTICIFLSDRRVSIVLELFFFSRSYRFYKTVRIAWKYYYSDIFNSLFFQKFLYQRSLIIRNFYCQVYHSWNWTLNRFRNSLQRLERLALNSLKNLILLSQTFLFPIYRAFIQVLNKPEYSISKMSLGDSILKSRSTRNSKKRRNRRNWSCNFDENSGSPWRVWSIVGRKKE